MGRELEWCSSKKKEVTPEKGRTFRHEKGDLSYVSMEIMEDPRNDV